MQSPSTIESKIKHLNEINQMIREFAAEYKISENRVRRILEASARKVFLKKNRKITLFAIEMQTICGFDLNENRDNKKLRYWTLSKSDYNQINDEMRASLEATYQKHLTSKRERLLKVLIDTELRGNRIIRASIVGVTDDRKKVVLKFKKKDGSVLDEPIFLVSLNNFLPSDQIKLGNLFSLWISSADYDHKKRKVNAFLATRKSNEVFEDEFQRIFKSTIAKYAQEGYEDEEILLLSRSLIKMENKGGNLFCEIRGDIKGLAQKFYANIAKIYFSRLSRKLIYSIK